MPTDDVNRVTLDSYDNSAERYEERTPSVVDGAFKESIDFVLRHLPPGASILEIGTGTGRDARYMEQAGFRVQRTEASDGLLRILASTGLNVEKLNVLNDEIPRGYDLVFANAVLHHFDATQMKLVLQKICNALDIGGLFAFSIKDGDGEEWETTKLGQPRYFLHWTKEKLELVLTGAGFEIVELRDGVKSNNDEMWLQALVRRCAAFQREDV